MLAAVLGRLFLTLGSGFALAGASLYGCVHEVPPSPSSHPSRRLPSPRLRLPPPARRPRLPHRPRPVGASTPRGIRPILEDSRLAAVKVEVNGEPTVPLPRPSALPSRSPRRLLPLQILPHSPPKTPGPLAYQLGRLRSLAGDPGGAAKAYAESATIPSTLAGYAHYQAATPPPRRGPVRRFLIAEAKLIPPDLAVVSAVDRILADALAGKKDFEGAQRFFRSYLAREKHPPGWVTVTLRFPAPSYTVPARPMPRRPSTSRAAWSSPVPQWRRSRHRAPPG